MFGISLALGPVLGGALIASVGWRGIFWVNVPVGLAALVLSALFVPESGAPRARGMDLVGQLLVITILASLIYAIIEGPSERLDLRQEPWFLRRRGEQGRRYRVGEPFRSGEGCPQAAPQDLCVASVW